MSIFCIFLRKISVGFDQQLVKFYTYLVNKRQYINRVLLQSCISFKNLCARVNDNKMPEAHTGEARLLSAQTSTGVQHCIQPKPHEIAPLRRPNQARLILDAHTFSPPMPLLVLHARMQRIQLKGIPAISNLDGYMARTQQKSSPNKVESRA
jgi:hypothetical protein